MIFNGISTVNMGVVIQTPPTYEFPSRDYTVVHVEGKTGDVIIDNGAYQNVRRTYYIASVFRNNTNFVLNAGAIIAWLMSAKGYARLEDSYEPDYFRLAMYRNQGEMRNIYDKVTTLSVIFECKPQRYLKTGEVEQIITEKDTYVMIVNPTDYIALPNIIVGGVDVTIDFYAGEDYNNPDKTSKIEMTYDGVGYIDSELQDCHDTISFINDKVVLTNGFPKFYPGVNWVKVTAAGEVQITIKPKWWLL